MGLKRMKRGLVLDASHFNGYFLLYPIPKFSRCAEKKCWPWNLVLPLTIFLMLIPIFFGIQQGRK